MKDSKSGRGNPVDLDQLSTPELERLLRNDFLASRGQTDPEFVAAAMEVIARRKDKTTPEVDVDAAWEKFQARMKKELEQKESTPEATPELPPSGVQGSKRPGGRRWLRRTVAAAALVAVLVCLSLVPVQGTSLVQSFVDWTGNTFSFGQESVSNEEQQIFSESLYQQVEKSISNLTNQPVLPTWYPEGSSIIRVEENTAGNGHNIVVIFSLENKEFSLSIGIYNTSEDLPIYEYEKNDGSVEEYYCSHIPHYIMGNMEQNCAVWRNELVECSIQGFLSVDTLKQMINSIYT